MKKSFVILAFLSFFGGLRSSAQHISWALGAGDTGSDQGYDISSDSLGNIYVTGWFTGVLQFGEEFLVSQGMQDIFLASFDRSGKLNWARRAGGPGNDVSAGIVTEGNGDTYITGWYAGAVDFSDSTIVSQGSFDMFIAKYDASGALHWVKSGGGVSDDYGNRVALTEDGGVIVAGSFRQTFLADSVQLTSSGNRDALFCRYSRDGKLLWVKQTGGIGEDRAYGIIKDNQNQFIVTGLFSDRVVLGGTLLTCNSFFGTYVAKMTGEGEFIWGVKGDGGANDFARGFGVVTDPEGHILVNGFFSGVLRIGGYALTAMGGQYDQDSYLVKLDADGQVMWARHSGGSGTDQGTDLQATAEGDIIEVGFFHDMAHWANQSIVSSDLADAFVARYDPDGNLI